MDCYLVRILYLSEAFWGTRIGNCDIKQTDAYLRTGETSGIKKPKSWFHNASLLVKVGIMATKSESLFTDDTSQTTESDSEWFFWNRTTSNYFCHFKVSSIISRYLDS